MGYSVHYGESLVEFDLPLGWRFLPSKRLAPKKEYPSVEEQTQKALDNPLPGKKLEQKLGKGKKVTLLVDDATRLTPVKKILPVLLEKLTSLGVLKKDISILIALGTHSPMKKEALIAKLGPDILDNYMILQHDCNADDLVKVGRLETGADIKVNKAVTQADMTIGIGVILPHPMNGFGGGPKILFPGVSNYQAIREHHLAWTTDKNSLFGRTKNNRFLEQVGHAAKLAGFDYSLNCVFDIEDKVAKVLFGPWKKVHQKGAEISRKICGMEFQSHSDVTIISGYPYMEPLQLMKPLALGSLLTKKSGTLILLAKSRSSFPPFFMEAFENITQKSQGKIKEYAVNEFNNGRLLLENAPIDLNCALFYALLCKANQKVVLVSEDLDQEQIRRLGFSHYQTLGKALAGESAIMPKALVNLAPLAGILPIMPKGTAMGF